MELHLFKLICPVGRTQLIKQIERIHIEFDIWRQLFYLLLKLRFFAHTVLHTISQTLESANKKLNAGPLFLILEEIGKLLDQLYWGDSCDVFYLLSLLNSYLSLDKSDKFLQSEFR